MATVKIGCPHCVGAGIIGSANVSVCPTCSGVGTVSEDDTQTLATVNTTVQAVAGIPLVVVAPKIMSTAAIKTVATKSK